MRFRKSLVLIAVSLCLMSTDSFAEMSYDGMEIRQLTNETIYPSVVNALVCCEEGTYGDFIPTVQRGGIFLKIRMKKDSELTIFNLSEKATARFRCDGVQRCYQDFRTAMIERRLDGLKVRIYCKRDWTAILNSGDPSAAYLGLSLWKGNITIDDTPQTNVSCMGQ